MTLIKQHLKQHLLSDVCEGTMPYLHKYKPQWKFPFLPPDCKGPCGPSTKGVERWWGNCPYTPPPKKKMWQTNFWIEMATAFSVIATVSEPLHIMEEQVQASDDHLTGQCTPRPPAGVEGEYCGMAGCRIPHGCKHEVDWVRQCSKALNNPARQTRPDWPGWGRRPGEPRQLQRTPQLLPC